MTGDQLTALIHLQRFLDSYAAEHEANPYWGPGGWAYGQLNEIILYEPKTQVPEVGTLNVPGVIHPADVRKVDELEKRVAELEARCNVLNQASGAYVSLFNGLEKRLAELERKLELLGVIATDEVVRKIQAERA